MILRFPNDLRTSNYERMCVFIDSLISFIHSRRRKIYEWQNIVTLFLRDLSHSTFHAEVVLSRFSRENRSSEFSGFLRSVLASKWHRRVPHPTTILWWYIPPPMRVSYIADIQNNVSRTAPDARFCRSHVSNEPDALAIRAHTRYLIYRLVCSFTSSLRVTGACAGRSYMYFVGALRIYTTCARVAHTRALRTETHVLRPLRLRAMSVFGCSRHLARCNVNYVSVSSSETRITWDDATRRPPRRWFRLGRTM